MTYPGFRLGRRPELNGLRGFAVLAVMLYHADSKFLRAGFIGVDFFFVISGFLITALLLEEYNATGRIGFKRFYMRRALRLGPALLTILAIYATASVFLFGFPKTYTYWADELVVLFYSTNWARAFSWHVPYHFAHGWSLSIEEQFYALWPPLLYLLLRRVKARWVVATATAGFALAALAWRNYLISAGSTDMRIYNGLDTRADSLIVGCLLGILMTSSFIPPEIRGWTSRFTTLAGIAAFLGMVALTEGPTWNAPVMFHWLYFGVDVLTAIVILDCLINPLSQVKRLLSFRPMVWIGTISYGLYLWHYPIYITLKDWHFTGGQVLLLGMPISLAAATASFYLVEQAFLKMKPRFSSPAVNQTDLRGATFPRTVVVR
jgi:peptidoglycan/LPS O-acetylase OafA/YrhL